VTERILLGFEVGSGESVFLPLHHLAIFGMTQLSGKTTTLEALISRSDLKAIAFITKRGETGFTRYNLVTPYYKPRSDWQFVEGLVNVALGEKVKYGTIEYAFQHLSGVVVVIPEAWEMLPQHRMTPVKWVAEQFIRKGAAIGNYLWLDSQDIGGIDKTPLRQCDNWLMGRMKEAHEVERILKQLLGLKIGKEEIQRLPLGHFYAAIGDSVHKVYVLPAGVPEEVGRKVALGEFSPEYVRDKFLKLRLLEGEELVWKQKYEEIKKQLAELTQEKMRIEAAAQKIRQKNIDLIYKVERLQEQLREKEAPQEVTKLRNRVSFLEAKNKDLTKRLERLEADLKLFSEFKSVLRRMGFGPTPTTAKLTTEMLGEVTVATEQPTLIVNRRRKRLELTDQTLEGKIAVVYAEGRLPADKWFTTTDVTLAFIAHGWPKDPRTGPTLDKFCQWGFFEKHYAGKRPEYRLRITPDQAREKGLLKEVEA